MKRYLLLLTCSTVFLAACNDTGDRAGAGDSQRTDTAAAMAEVPGNVTSAASVPVEDEVPPVQPGDVMGGAEVLTQDEADAADDIVIAPEPEEVVAGESNMGVDIYNSKCVACHGTGAAGAPKLDDKANWEKRIAQGQDVLVQHAIQGYKGEAGYMPPKGGFMNLSDGDISATVAYMISQIR